METKFCPKCNNILAEEVDESLRNEYKYFCETCDENFYEIEALDKIDEIYTVDDIENNNRTI